MWRFLLILAIALLHADALAAQSVRVRTGDQIRLHSPSPRGVFDVVEWSATSATLQDRHTGNQFELALASVDRLDLRVGRRSAGQGFLRGVGFGAATGVLSGAVVGYASGDDPPGILAFTAEEKALMFGMLFGGAGAVVGGVIGAAVPGGRWERVRLTPPLTVAPLPDGGVGISLSRPF